MDNFLHAIDFLAELLLEIVFPASQTLIGRINCLHICLSTAEVAVAIGPTSMLAGRAIGRWSLILSHFLNGIGVWLGGILLVDRVRCRVGLVSPLHGHFLAFLENGLLSIDWRVVAVMMKLRREVIISLRLGL
jgi:hypothetical protein